MWYWMEKSFHKCAYSCFFTKQEELRLIHGVTSDIISDWCFRFVGDDLSCHLHILSVPTVTFSDESWELSWLDDIVYFILKGSCLPLPSQLKEGESAYVTGVTGSPPEWIARGGLLPPVPLKLDPAGFTNTTLSAAPYRLNTVPLPTDLATFNPQPDLWRR